MRPRTVTLVLTIAVLALPAPALAGGWATVEMRTLPDDMAPGATWTAEFEQLQHGVTPYGGGNPSVLLVGRGGDPPARFPARPAGRPGLYRADVVLPDRGTVRYVVEDDFGRRHTFGSIRVSEGAASASTGGLSPAPAAALAAAALACAALAALVLVRRRRAV
jgi:hypothetical protein